MAQCGFGRGETWALKGSSISVEGPDGTTVAACRIGRATPRGMMSILFMLLAKRRVRCGPADASASAGSPVSETRRTVGNLEGE
jgi:hypothetical protein